MKIVLINPPQSTKYPQPPMGLALIAAVLEKAGYQVSVLDANALKINPENIPSLVSNSDIIGLTAMTPTIGAALEIARRVKQANSNVPIILGGAHVTLLPEETLNVAPEIEYAIRGEGELTIIELLHTLESKKPLSAIPGISYRENGKIISTTHKPAEVELDSLPYLASHLLPWQKYRPHPPHGRALPFAALITSRGCPYKCSYCSKPIFGFKAKMQTPERVIEEVVYLKQRFGVKELAFYDDVFTLDKKRAYEIAEGIINKNLKIYWTCETRVNLVDGDLLRHMKQAGCYAIAYGIESASQSILDTLSKGISLEQIEKAISLTRRVGLQTIGYFMIGSPGETPDTIRDTIHFAKRLKLDFAQFSATTPFPGTRLYELYRESTSQAIPWESFVYDKAGGEITPMFESSQLSRSDLQGWIRKSYREFYLRPSYIWQRVRQMTSPGDLKVNLKGLAMLWGNLR